MTFVSHADYSNQMAEKKFFVYILTNKKRGTFYVGVTSDLQKRIWEHRQGLVDSFTKKYRLKRLVYFEIFEDPEYAIKREKRLKKWPRVWKIEAIEKLNPDWKDLYEEICK